MSDPTNIDIAADEMTTPAIAYLPNQLVIGQLLSKSGIKVPTWLRSGMVPEYFRFFDAQVLVTGSGEVSRITSPQAYAPVSEILIFHVLPPATKDIEPDYDPTEPNREMVPVAAVCGAYRVDGIKRISALADFSAGLAAGHMQLFEPLYKATVSHPNLPALKPLKTPYLLLRQSKTIYMVK